MSQYASYINAAVLAVLIALATDPLINWLRRRGVHRAGVLAIALLVVYAVLGLLALLFIYGGAQFLKDLPDYKQQAQQTAAQIQATLQSMGLDSAGSSAVASQVDASPLLEATGQLIGALGNLLGNAITLFLLTTFIFVDVVLWPGRLEETARRGHSYAKRLAEFTGDLRQYIVVKVIVAASIGTLNSIMFYLVGVPDALLWGMLSGILNFIPFIGFWLGLIPPALLTFLTYGPERMLLLVTLYVAINGFVQNVIQPRLVVVRLSLTPFMNVASVTFWPLVLGPMGAIIGVPLTMAVRSLLLDADPTTRWLADLTSTRLPAPASIPSGAPGREAQGSDAEAAAP